MIYLGTPGRMIGIKCPASQSLDHDERYTFQNTLEGRRKAQTRPLGRRTWSLQTSDATTPADVGTLMQFVSGAWGSGPFVFVPADAPNTNLLTPEASLCDPLEVTLATGGAVLDTPPMVTPDGVFARSYVKSTANSLFFGKYRVPVLGGPVTGSAYVLGAGGAVQISWYDTTGAVMNTVVSSVKSTAGTVVRSYLTATPPVGAVSCMLSVNASATQACAPQLVAGHMLLAWADGQGCGKAVVHSVSRGQVLAAPGATYSNLSFTVSEVG